LTQNIFIDINKDFEKAKWNSEQLYENLKKSPIQKEDDNTK